MINPTLLKEIGREIAKKRLAANLTQPGLDNWAKIPVGSIAKFEKAQVNITIETLQKICEAMGCRLEIKIRKVINRKEVLEEDLF